MMQAQPPLSQLIYCSRVSPDLDISAVYDILEHSIRYNSERSITGMMVFNSRYFLQVLEGPETRVLVLRDKIQRDKRHRNFVTLGHEKITTRTWVNWSMSLVTPTASNRALFEQFNTHDGFDPYQLRFEQAHDMLHQLSKQLLKPQAL